MRVSGLFRSGMPRNIEVEQKFCDKIDFATDVPELAAVVTGGGPQGLLQFFKFVHRVSLMPRLPKEKVSNVHCGATPSSTYGIRTAPIIERLSSDLARRHHQPMFWIEIILHRLVDWIMEIPLNLLGREMESLLDRVVDRQKGRTRVRALKRKRTPRKRPR